MNEYFNLAITEMRAQVRQNQSMNHFITNKSSSRKHSSHGHNSVNSQRCKRLLTKLCLLELQQPYNRQAPLLMAVYSTTTVSDAVRTSWLQQWTTNCRCGSHTDLNRVFTEHKPLCVFCLYTHWGNAKLECFWTTNLKEDYGVLT